MFFFLSFLCSLFFTILKTLQWALGQQAYVGPYSPNDFLIELTVKLARSTVEILSPFPLKPLILKMKIFFLKIVFSLFCEQAKQM